MTHPLDPLRALTPARLLVPRAGVSYDTSTLLSLRADHAAARDAVRREATLTDALSSLPELRTRATSKDEYLLRPDLGRSLDDASRLRLSADFPRGRDLCVFVGDGLSAAAVEAQVPALLPLLTAHAESHALSMCPAFFVRHCRVGVLNDVGELTGAAVCVLLIGERPGLATARSLSAYMAYRPRSGDTDAKRNLISNIHERGVGTEEAARRILALAVRMREREESGTGVKEELGELLRG